MKHFRYAKGDEVIVTRDNGEVLEGVVSDADINLCTYKPSYCVDYYRGGIPLTLICVPEEAMKIVKYGRNSEGVKASYEVNVARAKGLPYQHIIDRYPVYKEYLQTLGNGCVTNCHQ